MCDNVFYEKKIKIKLFYEKNTNQILYLIQVSIEKNNVHECGFVFA